MPNPRPLSVPKVHHSYRWRKLRNAYMNAPIGDVPPRLCEHCWPERTVEATTVNHRLTVKEHPDLAFTWSNLERLCEEHTAAVDRDDLLRISRKRHGKARVGLDGYIIPDAPAPVPRGRHQRRNAETGRYEPKKKEPERDAAFDLLNSMPDG